MSELAAYLAGALTVLVVVNAWYVLARVARGWRESGRRGNR